jgi:hypothetical protein
VNALAEVPEGGGETAGGVGRGLVESGKDSAKRRREARYRASIALLRKWVGEGRCAGFLEIKFVSNFRTAVVERLRHRGTARHAEEQGDSERLRREVDLGCGGGGGVEEEEELVVD